MLPSIFVSSLPAKMFIAFILQSHLFVFLPSQLMASVTDAVPNHIIHLQPTYFDLVFFEEYQAFLLQ